MVVSAASPAAQAIGFAVLFATSAAFRAAPLAKPLTASFAVPAVPQAAQVTPLAVFLVLLAVSQAASLVSLTVLQAASSAATILAVLSSRDCATATARRTERKCVAPSSSCKTGNANGTTRAAARAAMIRETSGGWSSSQVRRSFAFLISTTAWLSPQPFVRRRTVPRFRRPGNFRFCPPGDPSPNPLTTFPEWVSP